MESKVASFAATPDPTFGRHGESGRRAPREPARPEGSNPDHPADLRLIIEEDQATGACLYTTVDRATGAIVQQLPRDTVLKLRDDVQYVAGAVIRAKA